MDRTTHARTSVNTFFCLSDRLRDSPGLFGQTRRSSIMCFCRTWGLHPDMIQAWPALYPGHTKPLASCLTSVSIDPIWKYASTIQQLVIIQSLLSNVDGTSWYLTAIKPTLYRTQVWNEIDDCYGNSRWFYLAPGEGRASVPLTSALICSL